MCPCQRFAHSLATGHAHDSGPVWVAGPSPYGSFIRTSTPVHPGAHLNISSIRTSIMISNSNSLCRERDAQSSARRTTSRHLRFRAVPRANRIPKTANTHYHSATSSTTELLACAPWLPWQCRDYRWFPPFLRSLHRLKSHRRKHSSLHYHRTMAS
jgi:hypothetical protein